jgi:hypothetical protein
MAYSTRRKSVNLSLLGIHVPRPAMKSPQTFSLPDDSILPPAKKIKRSHSDPTAPDVLQALRNSPIFAIPARKDIASSLAVHTPPPSPPPTTSGDLEPPAQHRKVDTEGINDDVVIATIEVLEKTDNRPHLLKELATAIAGHVHVVET